MPGGFCPLRSDSLSRVKTYVGDDGKIHFMDGTGADSVLNFSRTFILYAQKVSTASGYNTVTASVNAEPGTYLAFCCTTGIPTTNSATLYDTIPIGNNISYRKIGSYIYEINVTQNTTISVSRGSNTSNSYQYACISLMK